MLFNEPKLLKSRLCRRNCTSNVVSVLFNEPKLLKSQIARPPVARSGVSVLFNEPKLLKYVFRNRDLISVQLVSVLFNEPKLLKKIRGDGTENSSGFVSALQRAEIAEKNEPRLRAISRLLECSSTSRNC